MFFDTNLPESELDLIRYLHSHHRGARTTSCVGILLQNLWESYGNIPTDKTLLYASLMWESYWKDYESPGWSPTGTWDFFNYKDKFLQELRMSINSGAVNECHFFALFLASQSTKSGVPGFKQELHTYQQGMVRVLKTLLSQNPTGNFYQPLMKLYKFILSFSRRIMCRGDFSMPEYLLPDAATAVPPDPMEMQLIATRGRASSTSSSLGGYVVPGPMSVRHVEDEGFEHQWDYWNQSVCCLCNEFTTMGDCFQVFLESGENCKLPGNAIGTMRKKLDELVNIHNISYVFRTVPPPLSPPPREFSFTPLLIDNLFPPDNIFTLITFPRYPSDSIRFSL